MPPFIVTLTCLALFAVHAWLMLGHRQKMGADPKDRPQDPLFTDFLQYAAFAFIMGEQALAIWRRLSIAYASWFPSSALERFVDFLPLPSNDATLVLGVLIFVAGLWLRVHAIRILGRLFTFEIGIRPEHKIIEEGPYSMIRHPSYTGYLVMLIGMGLAFGSLFLMLAMLLPSLGFLILRMNQEERMLRRHFGAAYDEYMARTKRLVPYLY